MIMKYDYLRKSDREILLSYAVSRVSFTGDCDSSSPHLNGGDNLLSNF